MTLNRTRALLKLIILAAFAFSACFLFAAEIENSELTEWEQAQKAIAAGNTAESLRLLRICSFSGDKIIEAEQQLKAILASESAPLLADMPQSSPENLERLLEFYEEICGLTIADAGDWKTLLLAAFRLNDDAKFTVVGEKFLDRLRNGMRVEFDSEWVEPLEKLSALFENEWQIIYRWQVNRILANLPETREKFKTELENTGILAQTRARSVMGLAEVAMSLGDLEAARRHLDQVRFFNREFPDLDKMYARLKKVTQIQRLLGQAGQAMQKRDFKAASNYCDQVLKLDVNNLLAKDILRRIEEVKGHKPGATLSATDQQALKLRRLEADFRKAEKIQDIMQMRSLLKEMLLLKSDVAMIKKLEELEHEIQASRVNAEERFLEAEKLFAAGEYDKLQLFLNRNPGIMSSMERMVQIWEMKLMVNFYTGEMGPVELHNSAQNIIQKGGKSFFGSFVLMKLALADNKMDKAREHFKNAQALNPDFPGLRWPGWLLWMHGEGRYLVVTLLIVVLFFLIKLIRPAFAWFESTYWTRTRILSALFPSLALRSLENCFGNVHDNYERRQLFQLLVKCCEKTDNSIKGLKYAENLLELSPGDDIAINMIGRHLLKQPEISPDKMPLLLKFALNQKDDRKVVEKTGNFIRKSNQVKPEHLEFLRVYAQKFPDDKDMFALIGRSLLEIPASELPDSAVSMLEIAWKATDSDELWWNFWRSLMVNGKFEMALHLTEEALNRGKPIVAEKLLEVFDREQMAEAQVQIDQLNSFDQKTVIKTVQNLLTIKYVSNEMGEFLLQTLDRLLHEENPDVSGAARASYDFIKARVRSTESARAKLLSVSAAPAVSDARLSDEEMQVAEDFVETSGEDEILDTLESGYRKESESELDFSDNQTESYCEGTEAQEMQESTGENAEDGLDIFASLVEDEAEERWHSTDNSADFTEEDASIEKACVEEPDNVSEEIETFAAENLNDSEAEEFSAEEKKYVEADTLNEAPVEREDFSDLSDDEAEDEAYGEVDEEFDAEAEDEIEDDLDEETDEEDKFDDFDESEESEFARVGGELESISPEAEIENDEDAPEDYSDYLVGVPEDVAVGSGVKEVELSEEEVPEDYSDYLIGVDGGNENITEEKKSVVTFDQIQEFTLSEVNPEEIKDVIEGTAGEAEIEVRRKELFSTLDDIAAAPEVSQAWSEYVKTRPGVDLFSDLDE